MWAGLPGVRERHLYPSISYKVMEVSNFSTSARSVHADILPSAESLQLPVSKKIAIFVFCFRVFNKRHIHSHTSLKLWVTQSAIRTP